MDSIYTLKNVYKKYDNFGNITNALNNVDFSLKDGEIIVILGPSGSGKSTMLNVLAGIDSVTSGTIKFYDIMISDYTEEELIGYRRENLGFIFQSYNLISNLSVKENIELGSALSKNPLEIEHIIDTVGLKSHAHKFPYQLSGGQQQRVSIARAVVKNPKVLFCDEPTGALDEKTGKKVLEVIENINKEFGTTVIIVTHNPSIGKMANTVLKMNSGKIVEVIHNESLISAKDIEWA